MEQQQQRQGLVGAKVLLVDDHKLLLESLAELVEKEDIAGLWLATSAEEALPLIKAHQPDLLVSDVSLPGQDGFQLTKQVRRYFPKTKILLLTMHTDICYVEEAIEVGAHGFMNKTSSSSTLLRNMVGVLEGVLVFPTLSPAAYEAKKQNMQAQEPPSVLTQRETEILICLGAGYSNKEIARSLEMAEGTVKVHIKTILKKLNVKNRTQAALYAYENGYNAALES